MAIDTTPKQNDTQPAESPKASTPATPATPKASAPATPKASTPAAPKASTPATPKRKPASRTKPRTASKTRTRSSAKPRTRKPAARTARTETTTATTTAPRAEAQALDGGRQFVAGVIDTQEKAVKTFVDYQLRAAELSQIPGATAVADAQAQVLRSVTDVYVTAARAFLK